MNLASPWAAGVAERVARAARWVISQTTSSPQERVPLESCDRVERDMRQDALLDALTRAHRLAEQLPHGKAEDEVRRSIGALIEATERGAARDVRVRRVLDSVNALRARISTRGFVESRHDAVAVFESVVRGEVLPLLGPSRQ